MTQDEIIEMAQECNLIGMRPHLDGIYSESLVAFANLVAAKEREACAILCDNRSSFYLASRKWNLQKHEENRHYAKASEECASAIRGRGEQA